MYFAIEQIFSESPCTGRDRGSAPAHKLSLKFIREGENMTESAVVEILVRSLQQVNPRPLKGSQLSVLVKTVLPGFSPESFGHRTLREFIRKNAPEIMELGRTGMDISYCLKSSQTQIPFEEDSKDANSDVLSQLMRNTRAWKTFTTPQSSFCMYLTDRRILRTLHCQSKPLPEWREIRRMSSESLLEIGKEFVASLDDMQKSMLMPLLSDPKWWIPFFERLQPLNLKSRWIEFRRKRIREEFQRRLDELSTVAPVMAEKMPEAAQVVPPLVIASDVVQQSRAEFSIRQIAADVVQRMTESELRALNLPLGYVLDSLATR